MKTTSRRAIVATVILAGTVALIVQVLAGYLWFPFDAMFGDMWMSRVRHSLIDSGVPADLVARYVAFALLDLPVWCLLLVAAFCLGLSSNRLAKVAALSFTAWLPVMAFATGVWFHYVYLQDSGFSESVLRNVLFGFNTRIVPALITLAVGFSAWALGRLAGRLIRASKPENE